MGSALEIALGELLKHGDELKDVGEIIASEVGRGMLQNCTGFIAPPPPKYGGLSTDDYLKARSFGFQLSKNLQGNHTPAIAREDFSSLASACGLTPGKFYEIAIETARKNIPPYGNR